MSTIEPQKKGSIPPIIVGKMNDLVKMKSALEQLTLTGNDRDKTRAIESYCDGFLRFWRSEEAQGLDEYIYPLAVSSDEFIVLSTPHSTVHTAAALQHDPESEECKVAQDIKNHPSKVSFELETDNDDTLPPFDLPFDSDFPDNSPNKSEVIAPSPIPIVEESAARKHDHLQKIIFETLDGGEMFFSKLGEYLRKGNRPSLIETYLLCLELGFRGKYLVGDYYLNSYYAEAEPLQSYIVRAHDALKGGQGRQFLLERQQTSVGSHLIEWRLSNIGQSEDPVSPSHAAESANSRQLLSSHGSIVVRWTIGILVAALVAAVIFLSAQLVSIWNIHDEAVADLAEANLQISALIERISTSEAATEDVQQQLDNQRDLSGTLSAMEAKIESYETVLRQACQWRDAWLRYHGSQVPLFDCTLVE